MELSQWFRQQLQVSMDGFLWAVEQIPQDRLYQEPLSDRWSAARVVYHMLSYEQRLALPSILQWTGGPLPVASSQLADEMKEDYLWADGQRHEIQKMLADFKSIRIQQLEALSQLCLQSWNEERDTIWGQKPLKWVVTKTYQHTLEHTDELLKAYLFLWE